MFKFFQKIDPLNNMIPTLGSAIFKGTDMETRDQLPLYWRAEFSREINKDIKNPSFPQNVDRLKIYYMGILQFEIADLTQYPPYPEQYSLIKTTEDKEKRQVIASILSKLTNLYTP